MGKRTLQLCLIFILFAVQLIDAASRSSKSSEVLLSMSLEELLNFEVNTGTLTGIEAYRTPFSLTTIDSDHIRQTPARGLLDLMESYVPGAVFTNHWVGPRIGMRGIMGDQNNSFLLLVNGLNSNLNSNLGVTYEIQNKDLNDIEKVEFIRGPGSAIYGPGAIGGVINIITKNAKTSPGLKLYLQGNEHYRYGIIGASYGYSNNSLEAFVYASVSRSDGEKKLDYYYIDRAHGYGYGFMGPDWGNKGTGSPAPKMYEDYWNNPEIKISSEIKWADEWIWRTRYTTYNYTALTQESRTLSGLDSGGIIGKMFSSSLQNNHRFSDVLEVETLLSFTSQNHRQISFYRGDKEVSNHITQRHASYAENHANAKLTVNYDYSEQTKVAFGAEYSFQYYTPEWGMDKEDFILSYPYPIRFAVRSEDSGFHEQYGPSGFTTVISEDIEGSMVSLFGEVQYDFSSDVTLMFSSRTDKHEYSQWVTSPRAALMWNLDERNALKFIAQKSVRLPNFTDLYAEHRINDSFAEPEVMEGVEITYSRSQSKNLNFSATVYKNSVDQIAWHQLPNSNQSGNALVGVFDSAGLETEVLYHDNRNSISFSYTFMKQLDWDPIETIEAWVTGLDKERIYLEDYGENRVNNFPKQMAKFSYSRKLTKNTRAYLDARASWDYQQNAMLDAFSNAHFSSGNAETIQEMDNIRDALSDEGYGEASFTSNFSLSWTLPLQTRSVDMSLFVRNLISVNHVRYVYQFWESGNTRQYPRQAGFLKEPRTFGLKLDIEF